MFELLVSYEQETSLAFPCEEGTQSSFLGQLFQTLIKSWQPLLLALWLGNVSCSNSVHKNRKWLNNMLNYFYNSRFKLNGEKAWNCGICVSSNEMCQLYATELN